VGPQKIFPGQGGPVFYRWWGESGQPNLGPEGGNFQVSKKTPLGGGETKKRVFLAGGAPGFVAPKKGGMRVASAWGLGKDCFCGFR